MEEGGALQMLLGTYTPKVDEKGRLILPAKFRDRLAAGLVVTRTQERALAVYPMDEFEKMMQPLQNAPTTSKRVRDYQRMLTAGASQPGRPADLLRIGRDRTGASPAAGPGRTGHRFFITPLESTPPPPQLDGHRRT